MKYSWKGNPANLPDDYSVLKKLESMLIVNLWTNVALSSGATGSILDFKYTTNKQPHDLPNAVVVKFNDYTGPSVSNNIPAIDI